MAAVMIRSMIGHVPKAVLPWRVYRSGISKNCAGYLRVSRGQISFQLPAFFDLALPRSGDFMASFHLTLRAEYKI